MPKAYIRQVQVQMFASGIRQAYIVEYPLIQAEYDNFFLPVDAQRIKTHKVEYDHQFVQGEYLPRLAVLAMALKEGRFPIGI